MINGAGEAAPVRCTCCGSCCHLFTSALSSKTSRYQARLGTAGGVISACFVEVHPEKLERLSFAVLGDRKRIGHGVEVGTLSNHRVFVPLRWIRFLYPLPKNLRFHYSDICGNGRVGERGLR